MRSSCHREDSAEQSGAGAFTSLLNVATQDTQALTNAINTVISSYDEAHPDDQVLIQIMVPDVTVSGVIMTRVLADGSPYYVVNYDDESGKTDTITGGTGASKTIYVFRDVSVDAFDSERLRQFITLARRVETLCGHDALDMEFCLDRAGTLHLLQVRPICAHNHWDADVDAHVHGNIEYLIDFVEERTPPQPDIFGQHTILGVMPDWNPAEMIGLTPRPLAASLYREIITRRVWSEAREYMGYRAMPPEELMILLAGRPYIDVRISFNSFLPQGLSTKTGDTLVNLWLDRLNSHPHLHDKVEFEVAQTALDFCFDQHLDERYHGEISVAQREEFRAALRQLTLRCLGSDPRSSVDWAYSVVAGLQIRQKNRPLDCYDHIQRPIQTILILLEECRRFGTLPFSILARHAFIAESLLRTAVKRGALSAERVSAFKTSIRTVAGRMAHDFAAVSGGTMDESSFLSRYGHLRPSSYDILSPRYVDRSDLFAATSPIPLFEQDFIFTAGEKHALEALLAEAGLDLISPEHLEDYARRAIAGREQAKFIFTRNLSDVLELIAAWGQSLGFSRDDLSYLDIRAITEWASQVLLQDPQAHFHDLIQQGQTLFSLGRSLKLGYLIRSPRDIYVVPQHRSAPNFVGSGRVEAPLMVLHADSTCDQPLQGCIVCIENADPGFDWVFTRNIAGLVTLFGGTNSHMAIRCAEYGLPAAIGVGEHLFGQITAANRCILDVDSQNLRPAEICS